LVDLRGCCLEHVAGEERGVVECGLQGRNVEEGFREVAHSFVSGSFFGAIHFDELVFGWVGGFQSI